MFRIACLGIGYLLGCFQTAVLVSRTFYKKDIREYGSKNAGTTNVVRTIGLKPGLIVFAIDVLKGIAGFMICTAIFGGTSSFMTAGVRGFLPGLYGGLGVILGHNFPAFLKFRGGKGIASTLGVILCLNIYMGLIIYAIGFLILIIGKYMSITSITMAALLPILAIVFKFAPEEVLLCLAIGAMAIYQHRGNIKRLIEGNENKMSIMKKKS